MVGTEQQQAPLVAAQQWNSQQSTTWQLTYGTKGENYFSEEKSLLIKYFTVSVYFVIKTIYWSSNEHLDNNSKI
jgi:hypothetical protein